MFCNFYFEKNHRIDNNSATTETREKNKHRFGFGILRFLGKFSYMPFRNTQFFLNDICKLIFRDNFKDLSLKDGVIMGIHCNGKP